jgi:hypothetical protein
MKCVNCAGPRSPERCPYCGDGLTIAPPKMARENSLLGHRAVCIGHGDPCSQCGFGGTDARQRQLVSEYFTAQQLGDLQRMRQVSGVYETLLGGMGGGVLRYESGDRPEHIGGNLFARQHR